jgi:hypothetical protein
MHTRPVFPGNPLPMRISMFLLLLAASAPTLACSIAGYRPFVIHRFAKPEPKAVPAPSIERINFVAGMTDAGSCDGVGLISVEVRLKGVRRSRLRNYGYAIRPISGVNDAQLFDPDPVAGHSTDGESTVVTYFWTGITPDADGHVRWKLALHAVDRSGRHSPQTVLCVATDNSCARQEAAHPGK